MTEKTAKPAERKKMKASTARLLVMLAVLAIIAVGYFTRAGIGSLSGFGWDVFSILCPLGYLESILASKVFVPRALISFLAVVVLVILLGRVFCAWICPMPFLQKAFPGLKMRAGKKALKDEKAAEGAGEIAAAVEETAGETAVAAVEAAVEDASVAAEAADADAAPAKPNKFKFDSRFGVLLGALASAAIFGFPVFCLICPVGLTFATVYLVMRLFAFGEVAWTVIVVPAVLLIEVIFFRKWCGKICPLGAVMSLISGANKTLRPTIDDGKCLQTTKGINCLMCAKSCPQHINIRKPETSEVSLNNCTKCHECSEHCPAKAISFPFLPQKEGAAAAEEAK